RDSHVLYGVHLSSTSRRLRQHVSLLGEPTDEPRGLIQIQPGWWPSVRGLARGERAMRRWIDSMSLFIASSHPFFFVFHSTTAARPSIAPGSVLRHAAKRAVTDESATARHSYPVMSP